MNKKFIDKKKNNYILFRKIYLTSIIDKENMENSEEKV